MANPAYLSLSGKDQGLISADCSTQASVGNKYQSDHINEIMVLACSHNMSNADHVNKSTHNPLIITKYLDKSSPLLAQALTNREELNGTINFFRISAFGQQEKYYSVTIGGGIITDLSFDMPHTILQGDAELQEDVAIRYREISWTNHAAGTSGYAFWGDEN